MVSTDFKPTVPVANSNGPAPLSFCPELEKVVTGVNPLREFREVVYTVLSRRLVSFPVEVVGGEGHDYGNCVHTGKITPSRGLTDS